ncbi:27638_t:CDS:1, partial [Racocetra persica]
GGDSGGSLFSFAQDLRSVELIGIHIGRNRNLSYALPVEIILKSFDLALVTSKWQSSGSGSGS